MTNLTATQKWPKLVGQLMFVGFKGVNIPPSLRRRLAEGAVGGVIIFSRNIEEPAQLAALNEELRWLAPAETPLLLSVDQEGGRVQRLKAPLAIWPPMAEVAKLGDLRKTEEIGAAMGADLAALGFNLDFAPVLDVVDNQVNSVIGDRSFGATGEQAAKQALAWAAGLARAKVLACGKHFPGHGGPVADSHVTLPVEQRSLDELRQKDLLPFVAAAAASMPMLMSAHVLYPQIDAGHLGTLSYQISTKLLREEVGFRGVLISDDLEMTAAAASAEPGELAVAACLAGSDMLLFCHEEEKQVAAFEALIKAAEKSLAQSQRLEQAAARVRQLKSQLSATPYVRPTALQLEQMITNQRHRALLDLFVST